MEALEDRTVPTIVNVSALSNITEGGSYGIVQFSRDNTSGSLSLSFTITGTATNGTDYTLSTSSPVSFASGVATTNVNVTPIDDAFVEGTETIIFTIDSGSYTIGTGSATMNLFDNDLSPPPPPPPPPPATVVSVASLGNITEGGSSGTFELTRNNTSGTLSVPFSLSGSATSLIDYNVSPTAPATFASGSATTDITISPVDDSNVEGTEGINITLGIGAYTIGTGSATMDLFDNDNSQVSIASDGDVTEGDTGTFTISRTGSTASSLVVSYSMSGTATSGTDYTAPSCSATIPAGYSSVDVSIPTLADNVVEGNETVIATVADGGSNYSAHGSSAAATMTIDDDPPIITLIPTNVTEGNSSDVIFTRSGGDISSSLTISYSVGGTATSGTDYTALSGSVTIAAGDTSANVTIAALADNIVESSNETVSLEIFSTSSYLPPGGADTFTAVVTIVDDPPIVTVVSTGDATEGGDDGGFEFTRSGGDTTSSLTISYTVNGSATPGDDYTALSGSVAFGADELTADVAVSAVDDTSVENTETVIVSVGLSSNNLIGTPGTATVAIFDNDKLTLTPSTTNIPINADIDDKSQWIKDPVTGDPITGIPLLRDMDIAPIRDISSWNGTGDLPTGTAINDPDLKKMTAAVVNGDATGTITVTVIYPDGVTGGRISLWADQSKSTPILVGSLGISMGGSAALPGYPSFDFYVEGIRPSSSAGDITLRVSITQGGVTTNTDRYLTVTPVVNEFSVNPKNPAGSTFATNGMGQIYGISSGDLSNNTPGAKFTADLNVMNVNGKPLFLQNVTSLTHGSPAVTLTDGSEYNPAFDSETFPMQDVVPPNRNLPGLISTGAPFYPTYEGAVFDGNRNMINSYDFPGLGSLSFAGVLNSMDLTFQARMYLTWQFTDGSIYSLAMADWKTIFKASTVGGALTMDASSITTASTMLISNSNPATIIGTNYADIIAKDAMGLLWVEQ